jgi:hypothetical protein
MSTFEKHYTPAELAALWGCSTQTIHRMCTEMGGVFVINGPERMHKRGHRTFRIPASTAERMYKAHFAEPRYPTKTHNTDRRPNGRT